MAVDPAAQREAQPRWTRLATLGLVLAAIAPLLLLLAGTLWGLDSEGVPLPFFFITAAIALIGAFLVSRFGTWGKVAGIVASVLLGSVLSFTAFGLFTPNSFFDFVPGLLAIPGVLIAIVSCVAAIRASRRGDRPTAVTGGEQRGIRIVLGVVIALVAISGVLTFTGKSSVDEADADTTVTLSDFEYDKEDYQIEAGSQVLVRNNDPFLHTFTIEALDIDETLSPGSEVLVEIPSDPGDYIVFCQPHTSDPDDPSDDDMAATMTVE
jgi:plastocyanin